MSCLSLKAIKNALCSMLIAFSVVAMLCPSADAEAERWRTTFNDGQAASMAGNYPEAIKQYKLTLAYMGVPMQETADAGLVHLALGSAYRKNNQLDLAEQSLRTAEQIYLKVFDGDEDQAEVKIARMQLEQLQLARENPGARNLEVLSEGKQVVSRSLPNAIVQVIDKAESMNQEGQYSQAETAYIRALSMAQGDPYNTGMVLSYLGNFYKVNKKYPEAAAIYQKAIAYHIQVLDANHPRVAKDMNLLGEVYENMGKYPEAEAMYKSAMAIHKNVLGPKNPNTIAGLVKLAAIYRKSDRTEDALAIESQLRSLIGE